MLVFLFSKGKKRKKKKTPDKDGTFCIYHFCFFFSLFSFFSLSFSLHFCLFLSILRFGAVCFGLMIRYLGLECSNSNFEICNMWLFFGQCDKAREKVFEHGPVDEKRDLHLRYYTYCTEYDIHTIDCPYNIQHYTTVNRCMHLHLSTHTYIHTCTCWVKQLIMKGHQLPLLSTRTRVENTLLIKQPGLGIRSGASLQ